MKKVIAVAVVILATLTVTGCRGGALDTEYHEQQRKEYEERLDRLYKECIDAGGSFWMDENDGPDVDYSCTVPGTDVPSGNVEVEVNQ